MKSITIHGLDDRLSEEIERKAKQDGLSLNKTIKRLLEEALGLSLKRKTDRSSEFAEFLGVWSDEDLTQFEESIRDFETIDSKDWK